MAMKSFSIATSLSTFLLLTLIPITSSSSAEKPKVNEKWTAEYTFQGIPTFAHLPYSRCLADPSASYDIAIIGAPFDTAVSYRTGARFGPRAIRAASQRQRIGRAFNHRAGLNPYQSWAKVIDCGDIPVTPFDNKLALDMMTEAFDELLARGTSWVEEHAGTKFNDKETLTLQEAIENERRIPKLVTLGGDHSVALAALRALYKVYGPLAVLHFDAHLDTWSPSAYPSHWTSEHSAFTHGTFFHLAATSDPPIILPNASVHAGLRTRLSGTDFGDYLHESAVDPDDDLGGWFRIESDVIDDTIPPYGGTLGPDGIASMILDLIPPDIPVYLSVDIDVLDPAFAPGTGTPEPGGWSTRELIRILRGIEGLNVVGADVVEVAPAYDSVGEVTALAGAQVVYEIVTSLVKRGHEDHRKGMEGGRGRRGSYIKDGRQVVSPKRKGEVVIDKEKIKRANEKEKEKKVKDEL